MQIHEITEGFLRNVASGFVQGLTGVDMPRQSQPIPQNQTVAQTRTVVSVEQPGQTAPAKYYKTGNVWTNELGQEIRGATQKDYLDKLISTHGRSEPIPAQSNTQPAPSQTRRVSRRRSAK